MKQIAFLLLLPLLLLSSCLQDTDDVSRLDLIANSEEYANYRAENAKLANFLSGHTLDFDAIKSVIAKNSNTNLKNYPKGAFSHIENGNQYYARQIALKSKVQTLDNKFSYLSLSLDDRLKLIDLYAEKFGSPLQVIPTPQNKENHD